MQVFNAVETSGLFVPITADGTYGPLTINSGSPQTIIAEGNFGGGTLTFQISYFYGQCQPGDEGSMGVNLYVGNTLISWTANSSVDLFYSSGGIQIKAILTGSSGASLYVGVGS